MMKKVQNRYGSGSISKGMLAEKGGEDTEKARRDE